jgi:hypothetical protein
MDDQTYDFEGPLAVVDHQISTVFVDFLAMHEEIHDEAVHHQLQNDLIEHLWVTKGAALDDCCFS